MQVSGGIAAVALALAFLVTEQEVGPTVRDAYLLSFFFLFSGLAALLSASMAVGMMFEAVRIEDILESDPLYGAALLFLALALVLLAMAYVIMIVTLS